MSRYKVSLTKAQIIVINKALAYHEAVLEDVIDAGATKKEIGEAKAARNARLALFDQVPLARWLA